MNSKLNVHVSFFANYKSITPNQVNLYDWLQNDEYQDKVNKIRHIGDKGERDKIKATLPGITVSGLFQTRNKEGLVKHSGLICIDIDYKDNRHMSNFHEMKKILSTCPFVAYSGLSVSGTGYYAIIPILCPEKHEAHFKALEKIFANKGITIDTACKDVCRMRGYSWDPEPYINHNALPFKETIEEIPQTQIRRMKYRNGENRIQNAV